MRFVMWKLAILFNTILLAWAEISNFVDENENDIGKWEKTPKIVGGRSVAIEDYPYQAYVEVDNVGRCGGSIISTSWILSAAHCLVKVIDPSQVGVQFGTIEIMWQYTVSVKTVVMHPHFSKAKFDFDFGLLELITPLVYSTKIRAIPIPAQDAELPFFGNVIISGYGSTSRKDSDSPTKLRAATVKIFPYFWCNMFYEGIITSRMFCGGIFPFGGKGSCVGDSGGPVVHNNVLIGVVSFSGKSCASPFKPSVFAKVSIISNWIANFTKGV